jgi:erythromycin esterase
MPDIKDVAVPLRSINPDDEDWSDLAPIRALVGDARVVSIGESAHGIGEFYNLRQRLFRFLVKELGFTAYCTEFPFGDGVRVNAWIHGGPGGVNDVTEHGRHVALGWGREAGAQLEWMRAWNAEHGGKLNFYGLDALGSTAEMVRQCLARIPAKPGDAAFVDLADFGEGMAGTGALMSMPEDVRARLDQELADLVYRAEAAGDEIALRCAVGAVACVNSMVDQATNFAGGNRREEYMADNVAWVLQRQQRILIVAHNTHLRRDGPAVPALGSLLQAQLPEPPVVIGLTAGAGSVWRIDNMMTAPPNEWTISRQKLNPPADTMDAMMSKVGLPLHFVDLNRVSDTEVAEATKMMVFHDPWPVDLRQAFDGLIHVHSVRSTDESVDGARRTFTPG